MKVEIVNTVDPLQKKGALALFIGGMALVTFGKPGLGLIIFAIGMMAMEWVWRQERDFNGTMDERWEYTKWFYASTHKHSGNRLLHRMGIPLILSGAVLLLYTPLFMDAVYGRAWWVGLTLWVVGWCSNLYGHKYLEGSSPALTDDPFGVIAGPFFDFTGRLNDIPKSTPVAHAPTSDNGVVEVTADVQEDDQTADAVPVLEDSDVQAELNGVSLDDGHSEDRQPTTSV